MGQLFEQWPNTTARQYQVPLERTTTEYLGAESGRVVMSEIHPNDIAAHIAMLALEHGLPAALTDLDDQAELVAREYLHALAAVERELAASGRSMAPGALLAATGRDPAGIPFAPSRDRLVRAIHQLRFLLQAAQELI